jgi:hypothetical protein
MCVDEEIADHLLELARHFAQRAIELGADAGIVAEIAEISKRESRAH